MKTFIETVFGVIVGAVCVDTIKQKIDRRYMEGKRDGIRDAINITEEVVRNRKMKESEDKEE